VSTDIEFWLELANYLALFAALIFLSGAGFGWCLGRWFMRRAAAKKQQAWLAEQRRQHVERRALAEETVAFSDPAIDPEAGRFAPVVFFYNSLHADRPGAGIQPRIGR